MSSASSESSSASSSSSEDDSNCLRRGLRVVEAFLAAILACEQWPPLVQIMCKLITHFTAHSCRRSVRE